MNNQSSEDSTYNSYIFQTPTRSSTQIPQNPPTKPPVKMENINISSFNITDGKVVIDINDNKYENDIVYNISVPSDIKEITIDSNEKSISLVLSEETTEITINSNGESAKSIDIVPQAEEVTITLDEQTKASIQNAKGTITLNNGESKEITLNQVSPQSDKFTLISKVPIKIEEVDFSGQQGMNIQSTNKNDVKIEKVKIQSHSSGTINNAKINNIVLGLLSSLNIVDNVDMTDSSIDLPFNEQSSDSGSKALLFGKLRSIPARIVFNTRDFKYFEVSDRFLVAESGESGFECDKWAETFRRGPFNSKFNDAECTNESVEGKKVMRMYAFAKHSEDNNDKKPLSGGAIAGIVIACVVVVAIIIFVFIYFFVIKKKNSNENSSDEEVDEV